MKNLTVQPQPQRGIENIKKSFTETLSLVEKVNDLRKSFNWRKVGLLGLELAEFNAKIDTYREAIKEANDLDEQESKQLDVFFKDKVDLQNKKIEVAVEDGLSLIIRTYNFIREGIELGGDWIDYAPKFQIAFQDKAA